MGSKEEFLSEEELQELREEIDGFIGKRGIESKKQPEGQVISNVIDEVNTSALSIEKNGSYVTISKDNMTAWLYLMVPGEGRDNYTYDELVDFVKASGVVTGFHTSNLKAMIKKKVYERKIVVAQGQPAIEGNNGYFEYMFDLNQRKAPKVLANGRVDYTNMSTLQNVHKGEVVAIYHHAQEGQDGYDIKGKALAAKKVKEIPPLQGKALYHEDDPDVYLAEKDGKIELKNGKVDIQAIHEINDDVTLITGKVEFYGDVIINGNVESGVVIRAGRNIEIKGNVEAVSLFAGGDIVLSRGIQGGKRAKVSARGDIYADFIENTVVMAGGNVKANTILNSRVSADGEITLTGKKGAVIGGYTHAMMGIRATEIGNPVETRTVLHVGCEKEVYQKVQNIRAIENLKMSELKELSEEVDTINERKKRLDKLPDGLEIKLKLLESKVSAIKKELDESRAELRKLEELIAKGQDSEIIVNGNIYRGSVICIAQVQTPIANDTCFMKFFQQRGMIESSVIAYSPS